MNNQIEERKAKCLICLDQGVVELESTGDKIACPRGCAAPADIQHPFPFDIKPKGGTLT